MDAEQKNNERKFFSFFEEINPISQGVQKCLDTAFPNKSLQTHLFTLNQVDFAPNWFQITPNNFKLQRYKKVSQF